MQCPTRDELTACLLGQLPDARAEALLDHADACAVCRKIVEALEETTDGLTESLRAQSGPLRVTEGCKRMMIRAERLMEADAPPVDPTSTTRRHLLQGTVIRDYEIVRPLGEGGMGAVFLAKHLRLGHEVALKVLSVGRAADAEAQRRFRQEMTIVGQLQHPGIVRALDAGDQDGVQYLVMGFIDGVNLRQLIELMGQLSLADACELGRQTACALDYAHRQHLVHRDVKPSNLMLATDGTARLLDLGLARWTDHQCVTLTSTAQALGSLDFMAPEQLNGDPVDQRADIYGLACTLHFLLSGQPPEKRRTAALLVKRGPKLDQIREALPPPLTRLLHRMLAVEPNRRIESAAAVAQQLGPFCTRADLRLLAEKAKAMGTSLDARPSPGSITSANTKFSTRRTRLRWVVLAAAIALPLLVLLASTLALNLNSSEPKHIPLTQTATVTSQQRPTAEIPLFQLHNQAVRCVAYCEATSQLILGSDDASISVRDIPEQRQLTVVCQFEAPIRRIRLAADAPRAIALDRAGGMLLIQLPAAEVVKYLPPDTFQHRAVDVALLPDGHTVAIGHENGSLSLVTLSTGESLAERSLAEGTIDHLYVDDRGTKLLTLGQRGTVCWWTLPALQLDASAKIEPPESLMVSTAGGRMECLTASISDRLKLSGAGLFPACVLSAPETIRSVDVSTTAMLCLAHGKVARVLNLRADVPHQFTYLEHDQPITTIRALAPRGPLLSADESGEVRLWNAPSAAASDMLLASGPFTDSRMVSHSLRHQTTWRRKAFQSTPDRLVTLEPRPGEGLTITTKLVRGDRQHVLKYLVNAESSTRE